MSRAPWNNVLRAAVLLRKASVEKRNRGRRGPQNAHKSKIRLLFSLILLYYNIRLNNGSS